MDSPKSGNSGSHAQPASHTASNTSLAPVGQQHSGSHSRTASMERGKDASVGSNSGGSGGTGAQGNQGERTVSMSVGPGPGDQLTAIVKNTDMPDSMITESVTLAMRAIKSAQDQTKKEINHLVARAVKKEFDQKYGGLWHCVVGRNFGSFVVHQSRTFIYFYIGQIAVLLFKAGQ